MDLKRELECDAATGQQPAAKSSRTSDSGTEGSSHGGSRRLCCALRRQEAAKIFDHSTDPAAEATAAPKAAAAATAEPKAAAAKPAAAPAASFAERQQKIVLHAEQQFTYWWNVAQREKMQLRAHLDGNRRQLELQAPDMCNARGDVIGYLDPDPDIDRLHIKVWTPDREKYICFLDACFEDTIATLKKKSRSIQKSCI